MTDSTPRIIEDVRWWLSQVVIGLQLCPFAKAPFQKQHIRFFVSQVNTEDLLIEELVQQCHYLDNHDDIETTLLICPKQLDDFFDYTQFLVWAESALKQHGWQSIYQLASFHPDYQFYGSDFNDPQNLTNRSPYPIIHILRERSISQVLDRYSEPETIPEKNIETMRKLSQSQIQHYFYFLYHNK